LVAVVAEPLTAGKTEVAGFELDHGTGEDTQFQVAAVHSQDRDIAPMPPRQQFPEKPKTQ
jgi:hypothetical protein